MPLLPWFIISVLTSIALSKSSNTEAGHAHDSSHSYPSRPYNLPLSDQDEMKKAGDLKISRQRVSGHSRKVSQDLDLF
jgi:hypothetical protein